MISFFRRLRWNAKCRDELSSCMDYIHDQHFASLKRSTSLMDGMSADASVALYATVESIVAGGRRIRVDYSVTYKANLDALGCYHLLHSDTGIDELSHEPRDR